MALLFWIAFTLFFSHLCNADTGSCTHQKQVFQAIQKAAESGRLKEVSLPQCGMDGSFNPVQCTGSICYCVSKGGVPIYKENHIPYQDFVWRNKHMDCRCARDKLQRKELKDNMEEFGCLPNGNYRMV